MTRTALVAMVVWSCCLAGCKREPKGVPIALDSTPANRVDEGDAWARLAVSLSKEDPPRLNEALYASNQALGIMRPCAKAPDEPLCRGGQVTGDALRNRLLLEALLVHAHVLTELGQGRFALDVADEAARYGAGLSFPDRARGEALFQLKRYGDAIEAFRRAQEKPGPNYLMDAHIAHALARQGKKAEAEAAIAALNANLEAFRMKNPSSWAQVSGPNGEFGMVQRELDAIASEAGTRR